MKLESQFKVGNHVSNSNFVQNLKMIDAVTGEGTAVDTILELKKQGVFRGAKRKRHPNSCQSLMLDFINCTPREKMAVGGKEKRDEKSLK